MDNICFNSKISKWTVIEELPRKEYSCGQTRDLYLCSCSCGNVKQFYGYQLRSGKELHCEKCDKDNYIIYSHISPSGKKYIGQTKGDIKFRSGGDSAKNYKPKNGNRLPFYNAIKKYGFNNFEHIVLKDNIPSREEANYWEKYYIKKYNTIVPYGYNVSSGGYTNDCNFMKKKVIAFNGIDYLYFDSISDAGKYFGKSGSTISQAIKRERKSSGYYFMYEDTYNVEKERQIIDEAKGRKENIYVYDYFTKKLIGIFNTIKEAGEFTKTPMSGISKMLYEGGSYGVKQRNGYIFSLNQIEDFSCYFIKTKCKIVNKYDEWFNLVEMYDSLNDAANKNNINKSYLCNIIKRKSKHNGFIYSYSEVLQ